MENQIDRALLGRIYAEWFAPYEDCIGIIEDRGNTVFENRFLLGMYAGRSDLFNLTHEMAHLIEIDLPRCHLPDWGFKYGTYWEIGGRSGHEFHTTQAAWREIRTFGIQHHLNLHYGIRDSNDEGDSLYYMAKLVGWIENYEYIHGRDAEGGPLHRWNSHESRSALIPLILAEYAKWSIQSIRIRWTHRMYVLKKRQHAGALRQKRHWIPAPVSPYVPEDSQ